MASKRTQAFDGVPTRSTRSHADRPADSRPSRPRAHAQQRCAPLTQGQFRSLRRLAEQGVNPLRHL